MTMADGKMKQLERLIVWAARNLDYLVLGILAIVTIEVSVRPPQEPTVGGWAHLLVSPGLLLPAIFFTRSLGYAKLLWVSLTLILASGLSILLFAKAYQSLGIFDAGGYKVLPDLETAVYFSIVTWTTLGYGDFSPSDDARLFAATEAILGYVFMALMIGFAVAATSERR